MAIESGNRFNWGASICVPIGLVAFMWIIHFGAEEMGSSLVRFGLKPRTLAGLPGIFTMPFLHGSWSHLINNSIPLLVLGWALFHFYPSLAWKTLLGIVMLSGIWLWISGRSSYHIGASGLVYGLAAFLFLSGWLRKEKKVAAISLLVAFLYGSLWWGILPVDPTISWEGHLWGAVSGFALAFLYRKQGPQKPVYHWVEEDMIEEMGQAEFPVSPDDKTATGNQSSTGNYSYVFITPEVKNQESKDKDNPDFPKITG